MYLATIHAFLLTFLHIRFGNSNDFQIFFCHRKKRKKREKKKTESRKPFKRPQPRARTRNQATVEWSQERKLFFGDATRHQRGNNFSFFPFFFNGFQFSKFEVGAKFARSIGKPRHWPSQAAESYVFCRLTPVWKFEIFIISTFPDGMMPLPRPAETLTRQLLFDKKKRGFRQPTLAAIFSSSPLRNLTLPAWIDTKNVTNPSFALYRLNLRGRRNGNANFFSQLMENISFVVKIFLNLIPLQFERERDKYREYRVWAPLLWNLVLIHLFNLIPSRFSSEISNVESTVF